MNPRRTKATCVMAGGWLLVASAHGQTITTSIERVTIIDVVAGMARPDMTVVVVGNRIAAAGPASEVTTPTGARSVDGRGQFLIPGLWDMHVHLGNASEAALPLFVSCGITGVRDMGSPSFSTLRRWRIEALAGARIGPRIIAAGPILTEGPPYSHEMVVRGPASARRAVDMLAEEGVDFIKVGQSLSRDTYFAIADEARRLGLPLAGHLPVNGDGDFIVSGLEAANAGQRSLEHMHGVPLPFQKSDPELFPALLRNGTWVDPTLTAYWTRAHIHEQAAIQNDPRLKLIAPSFKQWWDSQLSGFSSDELSLKILNWRVSAIQTLHNAGVPLLAGTDVGFAYVYPGDLARELELFVQAGLPALDALRTATINPARFLNMEKDLGSVVPGKIADLVLLNGNPIADIRNARLVRAVIANGRFFDRAQLDAGLPNFK